MRIKRYLKVVVLIAAGCPVVVSPAKREREKGCEQKISTASWRPNRDRVESRFPPSVCVYKSRDHLRSPPLAASFFIIKLFLFKTWKSEREREKPFASYSTRCVCVCVSVYVERGLRPWTTGGWGGSMGEQTPPHNTTAIAWRHAELSATHTRSKAIFYFQAGGQEQPERHLMFTQKLTRWNGSNFSA